MLQFNVAMLQLHVMLAFFKNVQPIISLTLLYDGILKDNTSPIPLIDIAWIIAHNSIVKGQTNSSIEYT